MAWGSVVCSLLSRTLSPRFRLLRGWYRSSHHSSYTYRTHTCGELRNEHVGSKVTLCGWAMKPRVLGRAGVVFLPLGDSTGTVQVVCTDKDMRNFIKRLQPESVVKVDGVVAQRPCQDVNQRMPTGMVEIQPTSLEELNSAQECSFQPHVPGPTITEELRLKERHLDLRGPTMQRNLRLRSQVSLAMRDFLSNQHGFVEVETPVLFKPTAEGAREFLVPTRNTGKFYSLAQSPQQFKQLLMVGGVDRYFQFARCFRDEDLRSDRQPEFTQIDLEMSFVDVQGIISLVEDMLVHVIHHCLPGHTPIMCPFPQLSYADAIEQYGSDKPDTRLDIKLHDVSQKWEEAVMKSDRLPKQMHHLRMSCMRVPHFKRLSDSAKKELRSPLEAAEDGVVLLLTRCGVKVLSGCSKSEESSTPASALLGFCASHGDLLSELLREIGCGATGNQEEDDGCIFVASHACMEHMWLTLGKMRNIAISKLIGSGLIMPPTQPFHFMWIRDFPLFSLTSNSDAGTVVESNHHAFTAPFLEDVHLLFSDPTPEQLIKVRALHYDLVVNGWELGGGSIRIHNPSLQRHIFEHILEVDPDQFSHLLKGLGSGCPPHGGIALGFDRLIAVLCGTESLKDVIAFPKTHAGRDLLVGAPAELENRDLVDYHLTLLQKDQPNSCL